MEGDSHRQLQTEMKNLQNLVFSLTNDKEQLSADLDQTRVDLGLLSDVHDNLEIEKKRRETDFVAQIVGLKKELADVRSELRSCETAKEHFEKLGKEVEDKLRESKEDLEGMRERFETELKRSDKFAEQNVDLKNRIAGLRIMHSLSAARICKATLKIFEEYPGEVFSELFSREIWVKETVINPLASSTAIFFRLMQRGAREIGCAIEKLKKERNEMFTERGEWREKYEILVEKRAEEARVHKRVLREAEDVELELMLGSVCLGVVDCWGWFFGVLFMRERGRGFGGGGNWMLGC